MVKQTRGAAEPVRGVATIEDRRFESRAGLEDVAEVEGIEAAGDADCVKLIALDGDAPGAAPREGAEPPLAMIFTRFARLQRKPWVRLVASGAATALDDFCA